MYYKEKASIKMPAFDFGHYYEIYNIPVKLCNNPCIGLMYLREEKESDLVFDVPRRVRRGKFDLICNYCGKIEPIYGSFCVGSTYKNIEIEILGR